MNTVTPIRPEHRRAPHLDPQNVAVGWMFRYGHQLDRVTALEECTLHLMGEYDMSEHAAEIAAIQAYAEVSSVSQVAHIDIAATTQHVVVLRTMGGRPVMFTADDLVHVLESARDKGRARVVNTDTRRPVVIDQ